MPRQLNDPQSVERRIGRSIVADALRDLRCALPTDWSHLHRVEGEEHRLGVVQDVGQHHDVRAGSHGQILQNREALPGVVSANPEIAALESDRSIRELLAKQPCGDLGEGVFEVHALPEGERIPDEHRPDRSRRFALGELRAAETGGVGGVSDHVPGLEIATRVRVVDELDRGRRGVGVEELPGLIVAEDDELRGRRMGLVKPRNAGQAQHDLGQYQPRDQAQRDQQRALRPRRVDLIRRHPTLGVSIGILADEHDRRPLDSRDRRPAGGAGGKIAPGLADPRARGQTPSKMRVRSPG
jgi:hypothetical protein